LPRTSVVFYREDDGNVPLLEWFEDLPPKAIAKCRLKIEPYENLAMNCRGQRLTMCGMEQNPHRHTYEES